MRILCLVVGALVLTGCGERGFLSEPTEWSREIDQTEQASFAIQRALDDGVCGPLRDGRPDGVQTIFAPHGLRARVPSSAAPTATTAYGELLRTSSTSPPPDAEPRGPERLLDYLSELTSDLTLVERCSLKPFSMRLDPAGSSAYGHFDFRLGGRTAALEFIELQGRVRARLDRFSDGWKLAELEIRGLTRDTYRGSGFVDVSALTGVGLHRSPAKQAALLEDLGNYNVTSLGGLTVLDWNLDGALDLLVYNIGSLFHVFLNDGEGGFERVPSSRLIPPSQAAMFYLFLDLDGDGMEELVGSEPLTCGTGHDRIPIYRVSGGRMIDTGRGIELDYRCDDRFSHIAPEDVDGDGRVDLFVSNYGLAKQDVPLNHADARDGGRNRLFLNRGKLRFDDVTDGIGLDAATRRTLIGHWFDYNEDGVRDLLIVNDFAENELYLGSESGALQKSAYPPLTDSGFSMGVSVVDYDLDGDFDVYVSNMYSYAGHRILGVTPELDDVQHAKLTAMASGNTLYQNEGDGRYVEVAARHGLNNAQWAWGNVFFDYDNDGDRDVHVVNGMASNGDPRAKEAPDN